MRFVAVGVGVVVVGVVALRCVVFWCVLFVVWGVAVCCVVLCCCSACWSCLVCCFLLLRVVGCCGLGLLGASLLGLSCPSRLLVCAAACVACVVVRVFGFVSAAAVCRGCSGFCPRGVLVCLRDLADMALNLPLFGPYVARRPGACAWLTRTYGSATSARRSGGWTGLALSAYVTYSES